MAETATAVLIDPVRGQVARAVTLLDEPALELADMCENVSETPGHLYKSVHEELFTLPDEYATYAR